MVLLIGNYPPDRQQSMRRFGTMMLQGLNNSGIAAKLIAPQARFGKFRGAGSFVAKWLGYIDKFVLFPRQLQTALAKEKPSVVHICDHSNAMYDGWIEHVPVVVTCHDLLAVRGALGEETNCPASPTGKILQRWILRGLRRASEVVCESQASIRTFHLFCMSVQICAEKIETVHSEFLRVARKSGMSALFLPATR